MKECVLIQAISMCISVVGKIQPTLGLNNFYEGVEVLYSSTFSIIWLGFLLASDPKSGGFWNPPESGIPISWNLVDLEFQ